MDIKQIKYVCEQMLQIKWEPKLDDAALTTLDLCDSTLEVMYFLGACHFIEGMTKKHTGTTLTIKTSTVQYGGQRYTGIWILEPWNAWYLDELPPEQRSGPSALLFVPQLRSSQKDITHDFGLFYGNDNGSPTWRFAHAIEVDGYGAHTERRTKDQLRDTGLDYPVLRFFEETDKPLEWFRKVIFADAHKRMPQGRDD